MITNPLYPSMYVDGVGGLIGGISFVPTVGSPVTSLDFTKPQMRFKGGASGDAVTKAGNVDPLTWYLLQQDGVTKLDITNATSAKLRLKNLTTDVITEFSTTDPSPELVMDKTLSEITLTPGTSDFIAAALYEMEIVIYDGAGLPHNVPNDRYHAFRVLIL